MVAKLILLILLFILPNLRIEAMNLESTTKTQINEVTNFFNNNIKNRNNLEKNLNEMQQTTIKNSKGADKKFLNLVGDQDKINKQKKQLAAITPDNLANKGKELSNQKPWINDLLVNLDNTKNQQRLNIANNIATTTDKKLSNMLNNLHLYLTNCQEVAGNKIASPKFTIKSTQQTLAERQTTYHKKLCEKKKNKYSCRYRLEATCIKTAMQWEPWQRIKSKTIEGGHIVHNHYNWFSKKFWKRNYRRKKRFKLLLRNDNHVRQQIADEIARNNGKIAGHFRIVHIQSSGEGGSLIASGKKRQWMAPRYRVHYQYRDGHEICTKWLDEWRDECTLN